MKHPARPVPPTQRGSAGGAAWALLGALGLLSCVEVLPAAVPENRLLGAEAVEAESAATNYVGLELEESLGGSLDDLSFLSGLDVREVQEGSPARRAGLRRGDRVLEVDGVELLGLDQWAAALEAASPGDRLRLSIERDQGLSRVEVEVAGGARTELSLPTQWAERLRARAIFETRAPGPDGAGRAVLHQLLPDSPLEGELPPGRAITALDGRPVHSAQQLARSLAARDFGEEVCLEVETADGTEEVCVDLWAPPRRITSFKIPILFGWEAEANGDSSSLDILDLWLLSLYSFERDGQTRSHRFLYFFHFETGTGELTEIQPGQNVLADGPESRP